MYGAFLDRTHNAISALKKHLQTSERFRTALLDNALACSTGGACFNPELADPALAPDRVEWRILDHCAAVTRIYAIYEQFIHEMVREHLTLLQARIKYAELPQAVRTSYRAGVAKIIDKIDGPRFGEIDLSSLVKGYSDALVGESYSLEPRAMLMQEQNLRLPELQRFLAACGVEGVNYWIDRHRSVKAFFEVGGRTSESAQSEMAELIKYRNDAAHGSIDITDILHVNGLIEFCDFVQAICDSVAELMQLAGLRLLEAQQQVHVGGKVTESLKGGLVAIGTMGGAFRVGETVYLCGRDYCLERSILSLQLENVDHISIDLDPAAVLGMRLNAPGRKGAVLKRLVQEVRADEVEQAIEIEPAAT